jgi:hypothetical protein
MASGKRAAAQPHHLLDPVNDLDIAVGADADDDHVHRVGTDVDRGEPHIIEATLRRMRSHYCLNYSSTSGDAKDQSDRRYE